MLPLVVCVIAWVTGCTGGQGDDGGPDATPSTSRAAAPPTPGEPSPTVLPSLPPADQGLLAVELVDRTDGQTIHLDDAKSRGPVDITVVCIGGGVLTVRYLRAASFTVRCNGTPQGVYDQAVAAGPLDVVIQPENDQRWSARVTRGDREV